MDKEAMRMIQFQSDLNREAQNEASQSESMKYLPQMFDDVQKSQAAVIAETNPKHDIIEFVNELRGYEFKNGVWEKSKDKTPTINNLGAERLLILFRPLMTNNTRFARLDKTQVKKFTLSFTNNITLDLAIHWQEYEIADYSVCNYILDSSITLVYSILSRAEDQNEKNWVKGITVESINGVGGKKPGKETTSFWDKFKI